LRQEAGEQAPHQPVFEVHLNHIRRIGPVRTHRRLERHRADRGRAPPLARPLAPLSPALPQIVKGIGPGGIARKGRIGRIEAKRLDRADRLAFGVFETRTGPIKCGGYDLLQFFRIDADAFARAFEHVPKVVEVA